MVKLNVNGRPHDVDMQAGNSLLDLLREDLRLTGAKYGCGEGVCGACTVLVNGAATRACTLDPAALDDDDSITTIEGLSRDGELHPIQAAFVEKRAFQCGYCTPGMVLVAAAVLDRDPAPDDDTIRCALEGNICRCGGYPRVLEAVRSAADGAASAQGVTAPGGTSEAGTDEAQWTLVIPPTTEADAGRDWGWSTPGGARLVIDGRGRITAFTGKVDAGQGNRASIARMVAGELRTSTSMVHIAMGDTASSPFDRGTVGSRSTPDAGHALRLLAAAARHELCAEAARRWHTAPDAVTPQDGAVGDGSRKSGYGDIVAGNPRTITVGHDDPLPTATPALTDLDADSLRTNLIAAVTGRKRFPSDLTLPEMLHGRVLRPPAYGATLTTVDTTGVRRIPDAVVVRDGNFLAVAAPTRRAADAALQVLRPMWDLTDQPDEGELESYLRAHPPQPTAPAACREVGDVDTAGADGDLRLAATYTTAYVAHVPMETRVALAQVNSGDATVWVGTQRPFAVRETVADALGLPEDSVRIVVPDFGGGFGGKHTADVAVEAALLARAAQRPVRLSWTREEELTWAYFRPAAVIDVRSATSVDGRLESWEFRNVNSGAAGLFTPYDVRHRRERFQPADSPLPQGSYRALAATANNFARESHLDEIAVELDLDPLDLRLRHLHDTRLKDTLTAVTERIGWPPPAGRDGCGTGIACGIEKDGRVATAAEVVVDADGMLRVLRIVTAFDCGAVVDPQGLRNQVTGATIMGLGGALFEAIHFEGGRIQNASLADYRVPRFSDLPTIEVVIVDRPDQPSAGAGEAPIITVAPAIANAVYRATGRRIRQLPMLPGLNASASR
ncbi:MAG TPA: molybdopterin cofactor-binding domain-containing protein [Mycobacteriales bacterium]